MGKFLSFIWPSLILVCCFFAAPTSFSQTPDTVRNAEAAEEKKSALFNEGGYVRGLTLARVIGLAELVLGILSIAIAVRAKKRSSLKGAKAALVLGLLAVIFSVLHFMTTAGAVFGSGSGKAGAILAIILGLVGVMLARLVLRRKRI